MLHTCQNCGEAWSGNYILAHPEEFDVKPESRGVVECPNCAPKKLPGCPDDYTVNPCLARKFVLRLATSEGKVWYAGYHLPPLFAEADVSKRIKGAYRVSIEQSLEAAMEGIDMRTDLDALCITPGLEGVEYV